MSFKIEEVSPDSVLNPSGKGRTVKICSYCRKEFPATVDYFYKNSAANDGLANGCRPCSKEYSRNWHQKKLKENPQEIKKKVSKWYNENVEFQYLKQRERNQKLRKAAIDAYGGGCKCCGTTVFEFLTIDRPCE